MYIRRCDLKQNIRSTLIKTKGTSWFLLLSKEERLLLEKCRLRFFECLYQLWSRPVETTRI